jgi:predicted permease
MANWGQRLLRRNKLEEQLDKEMRFHMDQHANDLIARGCEPEEARRRASLSLGGPEQVKEECRDARGTRWVEDMWRDLRYAVRMLRQKPGFAAVALATLALGIGATTVMFTVINGVLLTPLPYPDPGRLVAVNGHADTLSVAGFELQRLAYYDFLDFQRESRSLELGGWVYTFGTLSEPGEAEHVVEFQASSSLFSVLGVPLYRGRAFLPEEDRGGGAPVVILGYGLWQRRFAGNDAVLGTAVVLDQKRYTVVGIAPESFRVDGDEPDVYTPIAQNTLGYMQNRGAHPVGTIARLRPGVTLGQAQAELATIGSRLARQYPDTNKGRRFVAASLRPPVDDVRSTLWLLLGAVTLVLLIACVNVANLLLARAVSRERELAMRVALGAGRGRLIRQCLTESAVLGLCGGVLGVLLAALGIRPFVMLWPGVLPRADEIQLDWRVLLFAIAVSLCSGLLFGLAPALRAPSRNLEQTLRAGARSLAGGSRRLHGGFVISEIALAVVLLVAAGMLGRTLLRQSALDPGVDIHNVLVTRMAISPGALSHPDQIRAAWQDVLDRARRVPGVQAVTTVDTVPMREGTNQIGYWTTPVEPLESQKPVVLAASVSPEYLKVMGIRLLSGRILDEHDRMGSRPVAVIDDVMAQQAFGGQAPLGKRLWIGMGSDPVTVVGVVSHVRQWGLAGDDQAAVRAQLYYPFTQVPDRLLRRWSELMSIAVRTGIDPRSVIGSLRRELRGAANDQVLYESRTMEELARDSLARQRFLMLLFGVFAGLALTLACIGIYGVLAYLTSQRVPEIGVRMALGAKTWDVVWLVLRGSLGMILVGVVLGTVAALAVGRVLQRVVEGMQPGEISAFVVMIPVLVTAALIASFVPARRASRVDPVKALRQE